MRFFNLEEEDNYDGIRLCSEGCAYLRSKTDSQWNFSTEVDCVGGFVMPTELKEKIEELKAKFGEPPKDLQWGYHKY